MDQICLAGCQSWRSGVRPRHLRACSVRIRQQEEHLDARCVLRERPRDARDAGSPAAESCCTLSEGGNALADGSQVQMAGGMTSFVTVS